MIYMFNNKHRQWSSSKWFIEISIFMWINNIYIEFLFSEIYSYIKCFSCVFQCIILCVGMSVHWASSDWLRILGELSDWFTIQYLWTECTWGTWVSNVCRLLARFSISHFIKVLKHSVNKYSFLYNVYSFSITT